MNIHHFQLFLGTLYTIYERYAEKGIEINVNWEETVKSVIAITTEYVQDFKSKIARQFGNPPINQTILLLNREKGRGNREDFGLGL